MVPMSKLQRSWNVVRFRNSRISDNYSAWFCVSFEFIVSNTTKTSSYFSLHSFSSSLTFWNMLTIINYYNIFVSWLSQSKLQKKDKRKKGNDFLSLQVSRSETCDNSRHSEYSCAGQLAVLLSCVSLVAHIGSRIVLVCSSHSGNRTKPTGP